MSRVTREKKRTRMERELVLHSLAGTQHEVFDAVQDVHAAARRLKAALIRVSKCGVGPNTAAVETQILRDALEMLAECERRLRVAAKREV